MGIPKPVYVIFAYATTPATTTITTTLTRNIKNVDNAAEQEINVYHSSEVFPELTLLQFCLCGMFLYLSTSKNFLINPGINSANGIQLDNDSNYLSFMLPTSINRHTKLTTDMNIATLVEMSPNSLCQDLPTWNDTNKQVERLLQTSTTIPRSNLFTGLADTAIAPVGAMVESYVINAIQYSVRRVAKPNTIRIKRHPVLEKILRQRMARGTDRMKIVRIASHQGSIKTSSTQLAWNAIVKKKNYSFLAVSSVVNMVSKPNHVVTKTSGSLLRRGKATFAGRKATSRYIVSRVATKPSSKLMIVPHHRLIQQSTGKSVRTMERHVGKSITRLSVRRQYRTPINLAIKFSNGCLVAVPIIGGLFSLSFSIQELNRAFEEVTRNAAITALLFSIASIADMIDALLHFVLSYVAYTKYTLKNMDLVNKISFVCMIASVASLVMAEIVLWRYPHCKDRSTTHPTLDEGNKVDKNNITSFFTNQQQVQFKGEVLR